MELKRYISTNNTYYPELPRKSQLAVLWDQLCHILTEKEINRYYFCYGLDVKSSKKKDYIGYKTFREVRDRLNKSNPYDYLCLLRDKHLFTLVAKEAGFPVTEEIGVVDNGKIVLNNGIESCLRPLYDDLYDGFLNIIKTMGGEVFLKPLDGMCGVNTHELHLINDELCLDDKTTDREILSAAFFGQKLVIQKKLIQHHNINEIYQHSVNTLRIVSCNPCHSSQNNDIVIIGQLCRIGAFGNIVDNWAKGGLVVGIDEVGKLNEYGFYKPGYGTKTKCHPDTGFQFCGFEVPYYNETIELVKQFHATVPQIHSIGWDIAITETGPCFIEGNDNWELGFVQLCNGGFRKKFHKYFLNKNV